MYAEEYSKLDNVQKAIADLGKEEKQILEGITEKNEQFTRSRNQNVCLYSSEFFCSRVSSYPVLTFRMPLLCEKLSFKAWM